jgi:putative transposase
MRRNQYNVEQIIAIVRQHENGRPAKELCRQYGFSEQTLKRWKAKYKGMPVAEAKRLKALEEENRRLKHVLAEITVEKRALEAALGKKW